MFAFDRPAPLRGRCRCRADGRLLVDDDALADVPDGGIGVIGAMPPELAVVVSSYPPKKLSPAAP